MPRFRGLSEVIREQIRREVTQVDIPDASPLAAHTSNVIPFELPSEGEQVQRWGFSTWGVEPITSVYKPQDD